MPKAWTAELEREICAKFARSKLSLRKLCKKYEHWPGEGSIYYRAINNQNFFEQFTRARIVKTTSFVDEIIEIADNSSRDTIINENGTEVCNHEWINRTRLRIETRRWQLSKLLKTYGDYTPKTLPYSIDFSQNLDYLSQEIADKLAQNVISLDEAQGAFDMLKKYAELVKVQQFGVKLDEIGATLAQKRTLNSIGVIEHGSEETKSLVQQGDEESPLKKRRIKKNARRKKGKKDTRSKATKSNKEQKPTHSKASETGRNIQKDEAPSKE